MRILLLGATGFIGRAVAKRLVADGHSVVGVVRKEADIATLKEGGLECLVAAGGFDDIATISTCAGECDAVLDVAAHDFAKATPFMLALRKMLSSGKVLISTTGGFFYGDVPESKMKPLSEDQPFGFIPQVREAWMNFEASVLDASTEGVLSCIVRPGSVYGHGGGGMANVVPRIQMAIKSGFSFYVDDGRDGAMSDVHVDDLADLYALILTALTSHALPSGSIVNASSGHTLHREIAEAVAGAAGGLPVRGITPKAAQEYLEPFRIWAGALTNITDNAKARSLGWNPSRPSLRQELSGASYKGLPAPEAKM